MTKSLDSLPKLRIGDLQPSLPIIQGGMAVRISLAPLAAAVANEGGIGVIGASGMHPSELKRHIREARELSKGIIGVNIMVACDEFADLVKTAICEKIDLIISGAGFSRDAFKLCRQADIPYVPIVSQVHGAALAEKLGAPAIIVEGGEAGGHLGTDKPLFEILREVVQKVKLSVIAAGGIMYRQDVRKAFGLGAKAVQIGTRFATSSESSAHYNWKEIILDAKKEDIIVINSPVGMPLRVVRTPFVEKIEAGGIPTLSEEFQKEYCRGCLSICKRDYCIFQRLVQAQKGNVEEGLFTIGTRGWEVKKILPVKTIMENLILKKT